jgi:hypothetical protein
MNSILTIQLLIFATVWTAIVYAINSLYARKLIQVQFKPAFLYIVTMAALGILGEIIYGTFYKYIFNQSLWDYQIIPIHNNYTSVYSLFLWGMVGFSIYLLHTTLKKRKVTNIHKLAVIFCLEAIVLEALVNISFLAFFGSYIYYYNPGDLWHITSLQTLPLYLLAGYITILTIRFASKRANPAIYGSLILAFTLVGAGVLSNK